MSLQALAGANLPSSSATFVGQDQFGTATGVIDGYWHTREKFQAVVDELGLKWSTDWEDLYKFWDKWRNPIIHRASRSTTERDFATFKIQSRIAGAIYLLVLRVMGYKGIAIKSVFEDVFTNL